MAERVGLNSPAYLRMAGPFFCATGIYFPWMASIAESFRSTCGSVRGIPECSTQRCPAATPHVGQGTETTCSGVSSFFFIPRCYSLRHAARLSNLGHVMQETTRDKSIAMTRTVRLLPDRVGSLHGNRSSAFVPKQR